MMGLGRGREDPVSLFDVFSKERFPFYLGIMAAIIIVALVFATIGAVQLDKPFGQSAWHGISALAEYLNSYSISFVSLRGIDCSTQIDCIQIQFFSRGHL